MLKKQNTKEYKDRRREIALKNNFSERLNGEGVEFRFQKGNKLGKKFSKDYFVNNKGKNNPSWKGGITSIERKIRKCFQYRQWRSDIFTRDNFTCQECGDNKGGNLEAHHIKQFCQIIKEYQIKTLEQAVACEELWNLNNGITFCEKCHQNFK